MKSMPDGCCGGDGCGVGREEDPEEFYCNDEKPVPLENLRRRFKDRVTTTGNSTGLTSTTARPSAQTSSTKAQRLSRRLSRAVPASAKE